MDQSIHNVKNIVISEIKTLKTKTNYRTILITTEDNNDLEITLFSKNKDDLKIKK